MAVLAYQNLPKKSDYLPGNRKLLSMGQELAGVPLLTYGVPQGSIQGPILSFCTFSFSMAFKAASITVMSYDVRTSQ